MSSNDPGTFIAELIREIAGYQQGSAIYRGEHAKFGTVSSNLYRDPDAKEALQRFGIQQLEQLELESARPHAPKGIDHDHLRALLQHYHGKTNAIDFTTDINIALFFACDGKYDQPGRIICLDRDRTTCEIDEPEEPAQRITAQKSVFVWPPEGLIHPDEYRELPVPADMKIPLLAYLRQYHGISRRTIYNDLLGFIHYRNSDQNQTMKRNAEALDLLDAGDRTQAIELLSISIARDPDSEFAYHLRASAYQQAGDPEAAIRDFTQAVRLLQFNPEAYALRALCHHETGRLAEAMMDANTAIHQAPDFSIAYNTRGLIRAELEDYDGAIQDFSEAINLDQDFSLAYNNRGFTWALQRLWMPAKRDFDMAIAAQPDLAIAYLNRGVALANLDRFPEAAKDIEQALKLDPALWNLLNSNEAFIVFRNR